MRSQQRRNKKQKQQKEDFTTKNLISKEEETPKQRDEEEMEDRENVTQFSEGIGEEIGEGTPPCNLNIQINEDEGTTENQQENPEIEKLQEDARQTTKEVCPNSYVENTP